VAGGGVKGGAKGNFWGYVTVGNQGRVLSSLEGGNVHTLGSQSGFTVHRGSRMNIKLSSKPQRRAADRRPACVRTFFALFSKRLADSPRLKGGTDYGTKST